MKLFRFSWCCKSILTGLLIIFCISCKKENIPSVSTTDASSLGQTSATSGGTVISDGGSPVSSRGVCWGLSDIPNINDSKTIDGAGNGNFSSVLTNLNAGTKYFFRAYATNNKGTGYGDIISFTTLPATTPILTTSDLTNITHTTAVSGGNIASDGGSPVIKRGVCWSINANPTITDNQTSDGTGNGSFVSNLTGLLSGTTYYLRSFATNSLGTSYGEVRSFKTVAFSDIDGNEFKTIQIGTQLWMAENLKTTKYSNGDIIGTTTPDTLEIRLENYPKYQWSYKSDENNLAIYGRLYTWYAVTDSRNLCPTGWHVPTYEDWRTLRIYIGATFYPADKLKEAGTTHWHAPNYGATNETGFTALPGGFRHSSGFTYISITGFFWSSTEYNSTDAYCLYMRYDASNMYLTNWPKNAGFSVRCLKD